MKINLTEGERKRIVYAMKHYEKTFGAALDMLCNPNDIIKKMKIKQEDLSL